MSTYSTHLRAHANLAEATGVKRNNIFLCENGETLELTSRGVRRGKPVPSGIVLVDGLSVGDTSEFVLNERTNLGSQGVAVVACAVKKGSKDITGKVLVEMHGIPGGDESELVDAVRGSVTSAMKRSLSKGDDCRALKKSARSALLSILWERTNQRPLVVINVIEL